jgi:hypothetical protein
VSQVQDPDYGDKGLEDLRNSPENIGPYGKNHADLTFAEKAYFKLLNTNDIVLVTACIPAVKKVTNKG